MLMMIFSHYFRRLGRRPEERERARKSGIGEDLDADDHQWMIGIIKWVRLMDEQIYRMTNISVDDPFEFTI